MANCCVLSTISIFSRCFMCFLPHEYVCFNVYTHLWTGMSLSYPLRFILADFSPPFVLIYFSISYLHNFVEPTMKRIFWVKIWQKCAYISAQWCTPRLLSCFQPIRTWTQEMMWRHLVCQYSPRCDTTICHQWVKFLWWLQTRNLQ